MTFFVESLSRRHGALVRRIGEYETVGEAIAAAKTTIDQFLWQALKSGMDAQALFAQYRARGEYPFIFRDDHCTLDGGRFNHIDYAMSRAKEICHSDK